MRKLLAFFAVSLFSVCLCQTLHAEVADSSSDDLRVYARFDMGFSIGETKFGKKGADSDSIAEIGGLCNTALGVGIGRSRFEIAYQERDSVSELISTMLGINSRFDAFSFMATAYYDYSKSEHVAMYIGAGAGSDRYHWQTSIWGQEQKGRGWFFIGGLYTGMAFLWTNVAWDIGLDYYYINEPETSSFVPKTGFRIRF